MNVLEATITMRWRDVAFNCWTAANGNKEQAFESFKSKKPAMMPPWAWAAIVAVIQGLMEHWLHNPPQSVMTSGEAAFLGLESD